MSENPLLSTAEVASYLGITVERVLGYVRTQEIPASWIGRKWRMSMADVNAFVTANKKSQR